MARAQPVIADLLLPAPDADTVRAARHAAGLSQAAMAQLLGCSKRAVEEWEYGRNPVDPARWALFLLAVGQHHTFELKTRQRAI